MEGPVGPSLEQPRKDGQLLPPASEEEVRRSAVEAEEKEPGLAGQGGYFRSGTLTAEDAAALRWGLASIASDGAPRLGAPLEIARRSSTRNATNDPPRIASHRDHRTVGLDPRVWSAIAPNAAESA